MEINKYIVRVSNDYMKDKEIYYVESTPTYIEEYTYNLSRDLWDDYGGLDDLVRDLGYEPDEVEPDSEEEYNMIDAIEFEIQEIKPFTYSYEEFKGSDEDWNKLNVIKW